MTLRESPSQTAGPYIHIGCNPNFAGIAGVWERDLGQAMVSPATRGERIVVTGRVFDGGGAALTDALLEVWQADADGGYNRDPGFPGWGRQPTDMTSGLFRFETIKPGCVTCPDGRVMAPHISVWIVARGINTGLHTRLYFEDEAALNASDPLLARIPDPNRRRTLLARRDEAGRYVFDIRLQGPDETVFLDI